MNRIGHLGVAVVLTATSVTAAPIAAFAVDPPITKQLEGLGRKVERLTGEQVSALISGQLVHFVGSWETQFNPDGTYLGTFPGAPQFPEQRGRWTVNADGSLVLVGETDHDQIAGTYVFSRQRGTWYAEHVPPEPGDPMALSFNGNSRNP